MSDSVERESGGHWYLVRTKAGEERRAKVELSRFAEEAFLPLLKTRVRRCAAPVEMVVPLFACYLFVALDMEREYHHVRYTRGVQYVVRSGDRPVVVPDRIIRELKARCSGGPIEIPRRKYSAGSLVRIASGPFQDFEGIFERELSGSERVAILLSIMGAGIRVVVPEIIVEPVN